MYNRCCPGAAMDSDLLELIDLVIEKERQVTHYYQAMAALLPEHGATWHRLSSQKESHAAALLRVREIVAARPLDFKPGRFQAVTVRRMIRDISTMIDDIRGGKVHAQYALTFAGDLERSLLQRGLDGLIDTAVPEALEILRSLKTETSAHQELLVLKALEEYGPAPVDMARAAVTALPAPIPPRPTVVRPAFPPAGSGSTPDSET